MTDEEYVVGMGLQCPNCGSVQLEGGPIEVNAGTAWQPMSCADCESTWNDVYKLTGFNELKTPEDS